MPANKLNIKKARHFPDGIGLCAVSGFVFLFVLLIASTLDYLACFILSIILILFAAVISKFLQGVLPIAAFCAGAAFGLYGIYLFTVYQPVLNFVGSELEIEGVVIEQSYAQNDRGTYIIETESLGQKTKLLLYADDIIVHQGDRVLFNGKISKLKGNVEFDTEYHYFSKGIFLSASAKSELLIEKADFYPLSFYINNFNRYIKSHILKSMPNDYGAFLSGIFLGDKTEMSLELKSDARRTGIAHLTAVSGLHLTVIIHLFVGVLSKLSIFRNRFLRFGILFIVVNILMIFFNLSVSVIRAGIMMLIYYGSGLFLRRGDTLNSLGLAILIILLPQPYACLDMGLLLSIAGTFGIGVFAPYLTKKLGVITFACDQSKDSVNKEINPFSRFKRAAQVIVELFLSSTCAWVCTLPLVAVFFKGISLTAVIISVIIQPFFYIGFLAMIMFSLSGGYLTIFLFIAGLMSKIMVWLVNFFAGFKYCYIPLDYDFILPWALASSLFIAVTAIIFKRDVRIYKSILISLCMLSFMVTFYQFENYKNPHLYIYSDGEAGAIFLRQKNTLAVIATQDKQSIHTKISEYLKDNYLDEITFLCFINNSESYAKTNSLYTAFSDEISNLKYDINGKFEFYKYDDQYILLCDDIKIAINEIDKTQGYADIRIISRYKQRLPEDFKNSSDKIIYLSSRMEAHDDKETNAYYEKTEFILLSTGE